MTVHAVGDEQDPAAGRPGPAAPNPLQRLMQQRLRERGWSYDDVARRGGTSHSTIHTLATTRNLARPPRPDTGLQPARHRPFTSRAGEDAGCHLPSSNWRRISPVTQRGPHEGGHTTAYR